MNQTATRFSLKRKLLLVSAAVLIIPYMGFDYLRQMESYLRDTLESSLVDTAYAVAGGLNNDYSLFNSYSSAKDNGLFIHELNHTVQLDGYTAEWIAYLDWSNTYQSETSEDSFKLIASTDDNYYYVLIQVNDNVLRYTSPENKNGIDGDHLVMVFTDKQYQLDRYYFVPTGPGSLLPFRYEQRFDEYGVETEVQLDVTNITAVWQKVEHGYNIEIKIPEYMIGEKLGFILRDVDQASPDSNYDTVATARAETFLRPNSLLRSSPEIQNIILTQGRSEGRRIWVLDQFGQVLASDGSLKRSFPENAFNILYTLLLPPAYDQFKDDLAGASRLQGDEVASALTGHAATRWRSSPDKKAVIVSAATPIWLGDSVAGAVVVEETTNNIQIMQRQVLANLFNKTLLIFLIVVVLLLWFAGRLSSRLIRLNKETSAAIDEYGKVSGEFIPSNANDEIGELSRSFSQMLERLQHYHRYLEGMAGRLSHELKTPMAIVRSSLDRLKEEQDEQQRQATLLAADEGLQRLQTILSRLSEAARLEQALQEAEKQMVDINAFLSECIEAYRLAYPDHKFELELPDARVERSINRDLFYQMLDKFVSNATGFSRPDSPVIIQLSKQDISCVITISNYGPLLPEGMEQDLFHSMISIRDKRSSETPHLGLGLFVARLVAEFHQFSLSANNLDSDDGVCIKIEL